MSKRFVKGMLLYALIFLVVTGAGLAVFWNFIDAYEQSRPINAAKSYVNSLTAEDMFAGSEELFSSLDSNLQSREQACEVILNSVSDDISYAKNASKSTAQNQVYILRDGKQVIGEFSIAPTSEGKFGFSVWSVTDSSFDFSYLFGESVHVTVPTDYTVCINGYPLNDAYISESEIRYEALEEFYDNVPLPTMVTYTADSFLGKPYVEIFDRTGETTQIASDTLQYLPACTQEMGTELDTLVNDFIQAYVTFTGSSNRAANRNYQNLMNYLIRGSDLANRLLTAIDGLRYAQSNGDTIRSVDVHQLAVLDDVRYYCDVTYIVETWGREGAVETTNNLKLIIVETEDGLRVEAMTRY